MKEFLRWKAIAPYTLKAEFKGNTILLQKSSTCPYPLLKLNEEQIATPLTMFDGIEKANKIASTL
jgi:hypothetical protein